MKTMKNHSPIFIVLFVVTLILFATELYDVQAQGPISSPEVTIYKLPFTGGNIHEITRGGTAGVDGATHRAYDFGMKTGTIIRAARSGTVYDVVESNWETCDTQDGCDANWVIIRHDDNDNDPNNDTFGWYLHIQQNGSLVNEGDYVYRGDCIAYSDDVGYATFEHLHFNVNSSGDDNAHENRILVSWAEAPRDNPNLNYDHQDSPISQNISGECDDHAFRYESQNISSTTINPGEVFTINYKIANTGNVTWQKDLIV